MTLSFSAASFAPRMLRYHPAANQNTLTIARGPLIYCAEDVDNEWVNDHFKSVSLSSKANLEESIGHDDILDESYIKIIASGTKVVDDKLAVPTGSFPGFEVGCEDNLKSQEVDMAFIPYYYRGNRGGKGHMRVGFRRID